MAIRRFKPTPRQELIGRAALVALGVLCVLLGLRCGWVTIQVFAAVAQDHVSDRPYQLVEPFAVAAGFLILIGVTFVGLAFTPGRDRQPWPWRAARRVDRAFESFWKVVERLRQ